MQAKTERFEMRLDQHTIDRLDAWRGRQLDIPSRSEAVRRLLDLALEEPTGAELSFSEGERLIILMLCDVLANTKGAKEFDTDFLSTAVREGHNWALSLRLSGLFHGHQTNPRVAREAAEIMDMWSFIEWGYENLSKDQQAAVDAATSRARPRFPGFDGNYESEHLGVAQMLVDKMDRFAKFKDRDLNSHHPTLSTARRMLQVYKKFREGFFHDLSAKQIIELLNVRSA